MATKPHFKPLQLALWLVVGGISFGLSLGWGWLVLLGFIAPIIVIGMWLLGYFLK